MGYLQLQRMGFHDRFVGKLPWWPKIVYPQLHTSLTNNYNFFIGCVQ